MQAFAQESGANLVQTLEWVACCAMICTRLGCMVSLFSALRVCGGELQSRCCVFSWWSSVFQSVFSWWSRGSSQPGNGSLDANSKHLAPNKHLTYTQHTCQHCEQTIVNTLHPNTHAYSALLSKVSRVSGSLLIVEFRHTSFSLNNFYSSLHVRLASNFSLPFLQEEASTLGIEEVAATPREEIQPRTSPHSLAPPIVGPTTPSTSCAMQHQRMSAPLRHHPPLQ